ncbi:hypothetical protein BC332_25265 [Capsicum chinense]|nr:hypothetical protein BC332_25265 [Capsicum chinense]
MVESSESDDTLTSVDTEDVVIENRNDPPAGQGNGVDGYVAGRSSQHRLSYSEGVSNDQNDLVSPLKKERHNQSVGDDEPQQKEAVDGNDQLRGNVCYDIPDGMPRFYVLIRKVYCPEFKEEEEKKEKKEKKKKKNKKEKEIKEKENKEKKEKKKEKKKKEKEQKKKEKEKKKKKTKKEMKEME